MASDTRARTERYPQLVPILDLGLFGSLGIDFACDVVPPFLNHATELGQDGVRIQVTPATLERIELLREAAVATDQDGVVGFRIRLDAFVVDESLKVRAWYCLQVARVRRRGICSGRLQIPQRFQPPHLRRSTLPPPPRGHLPQQPTKKTSVRE